MPIEKPLRKGGYFTNMDGERCWVSFKYEILPTFCFTCRKIGHVEKHCSMVIEKQPLEFPYREWMRAGGTLKGTNKGSRASGSRSHKAKSGGKPGTKSQATVGDLVVSVQSGNEGSSSLDEKDNLEERKIFEKERHDGRSDWCAARNQSGWDNFRSEKQELRKEKGPHIAQKVTKSCLVKELFKTNEKGLSIVGQSMKPNKDEQEVTSPFKPMKSKENNESGGGKCGAGKGYFKKIAREVGKAHEASMKTQEVLVGTKRRENTKELAESEGWFQKKSCDGEGKKKEKICEETTVVARQHH